MAALYTTNVTVSVHHDGGRNPRTYPKGSVVSEEELGGEEAVKALLRDDHIKRISATEAKERDLVPAEPPAEVTNDPADKG